MLSLRIALRYLFSRKSHSAVNIISFISMAGVAIATVATVCVLSVFNGFTELAKDRMSLMDPELLVERADGRVIEDADTMAARLATLPEIYLAVPSLKAQALAMHQDNQTPVMLKGVGMGYDKLTGIDSLYLEGGYVPQGESLYDDVPELEQWNYASLSVGAAVRLASATGFSDFLCVYVPRRVGRINPANPLGAFTADSLIISGVFETLQQDYDTDMIIMPIDDVRALLEYDAGEASAIEVATSSRVSVDAVKAQLQERLGPKYTVKDRMEQQVQAFHMIKIEKWISFLLLAFILIIASFNIISTLSILIIEKRSNMATLTALGATRKMLARIFMIEGWLIALGGGVIGIIIGVGLCLGQQHFGWIQLAGDTSHLTITTYPVVVDPIDLLAVLALVAFTGLLSTAITRRFVRSRTSAK